jgi:hypothetical protein
MGVSGFSVFYAAFLGGGPRPVRKLPVRLGGVSARRARRLPAAGAAGAVPGHPADAPAAAGGPAAERERDVQHDVAAGGADVRRDGKRGGVDGRHQLRSAVAGGRAFPVHGVARHSITPVTSRGQVGNRA